ncbi:MAG: tetratricopeptide repeat protein [Betaproteobacteria bacterium]
MQALAGPTTILFTDIEGSTRLWEQDAARMSRALALHDTLARRAVEASGGLVVKMFGDGMFAVFADPAEALDATLALLQSLAEPASTGDVALTIRCGLHVGAVEHRDNDYFGPPVNRTARIMAAAHGGQVLLSESFVEGLGSRLSSGMALRDLGSVRLKDLASPERLSQLVHPALRDSFPPLRSLESTPNNLPQQLTTFLGRDRELQEIAKLLPTSRLLTLLGMGGLGKTRLSLQIAADALDAFADGVWFIDLAPLQDPTLVPSAVAQELGVQEEPGRALTQTLCAHLKARKLLLILDNCEHLVHPCAALANALLQAAPDLRIIATSREVLRVRGEQTYSVLPLPVPDRNAGVDALAKSAAVQLFVDRARLHKPSFELTEREAPAVAELCARLEGIPLALELAAARMRALSVTEINARLRDRFKLLTGGGRLLMERQQTLRALVAWSYDLLQPNEQVLLDRLCVFAGGFDLDTCSAVCGTDPLEPDDVLDLLTSLADKSLVMAEDLDDGTRYRTLETIREYSREKLAARGEFADTSARHCQHFFAMAKAARAGLLGAEQGTWILRVETELDNMRAAMALALEGGVDPIIAVKFQVALMGFWILRGYVAEGLKLVKAALELPEVVASDVAMGHALYVGAALALSHSDYAKAADSLETCLAVRRVMDSPVDVAATLSTLSLVRLRLGDAPRARASEQEAIEIFRSIEDRVGEAIGLLHLGQIAAHLGEFDDARAHFAQCIALARELKHSEVEGESERMLGEIALETGDAKASHARFIRSLALCRDAGDRRGEAASLWWLGKVDLAAGEVDHARERLGTALRSFETIEMREELIGCIEDHARLAFLRGAAEDSARLYAAAETQRDRTMLQRAPRVHQRWSDDVAATRVTLGDTVFESAWAEGKAWELSEIIRHALAEVATELRTTVTA